MFFKNISRIEELQPLERIEVRAYSPNESAVSVGFKKKIPPENVPHG
jgi:hypothetical protein